MSALTARGFRCIGMDRRGCGRSTKGRRAIDLDLLADDLHGALGALELRDAVWSRTQWAPPRRHGC
jgi:pimeloyl-ACP methyl ester carboxylesterase